MKLAKMNKENYTLAS